MVEDVSLTRMLCPACVRTKYQLLIEDCPVCSGRGVLVLGRPALHFYDAETVATAIRLALEASARAVVSSTTLSDPRGALLRERVQLLTDAGLLHTSEKVDAPPPGETARGLAEYASNEQLTLFDVNVSSPELVTYEYQESDRPRARGLPVLSAAGHPSAVALICDPADPFGSTRQEVRVHRKRLREAVVLDRAHEDAARRRRGKVVE